MHPLRAKLMEAEAELRAALPAVVLDFWGTSSSPAAHEHWLDKYAEVLATALAQTTFEPLEMPDARSPPAGELLLAWAMRREGAAMATFPACADVDPERTDLGGTGGSSTTCTVYRGPLTLRGIVRVTGTVVIVGDLTVEGAVYDGWASDSALVVIGTETVRTMQASGDHIVTGDLVADVLAIESEETGIANGGAIRARFVIADHWKPAGGHAIVLATDDLGRLIERLDPRPDGAELDPAEIVERVGSGEWKLY